MTLRKLVRKWWRQTTAVSERPAAVLPIDRSTAHVPAEYLSLYTYLEHRYACVVVLTFEQMEALLGFTLPAPASTERDWWMGGAVHTWHHSAAWTAAGRTATPNLVGRTVMFERPVDWYPG
jgi:hypothetical protein